MYDFFSKLVVCGLLIYSTFVSTPEQAIAVFTSKRFEPTLTPSQVRYHGSKMGTFGLFISFIYHTCSFFSNVQKLFLFFFSQNYCSFSIYFVRFLTERPFSKSIKKTLVQYKRLFRKDSFVLSTKNIVLSAGNVNVRLYFFSLVFEKQLFHYLNDPSCSSIVFFLNDTIIHEKCRSFN